MGLVVTQMSIQWGCRHLFSHHSLVLPVRLHLMNVLWGASKLEHVPRGGLWMGGC